MKNIFYNIGYFLKEVRAIIRTNLLSNIFSIFSIGLILFILAMIISGWWISNEIVEVIQEEAEINVYFNEDIDENGSLKLVEEIKAMEGVWEARVVGEDEAYGRMVAILGEEARVLEAFDDNPFSSFIEVKIHLEKIDPVLEKLQFTNGIEYVRDNREVLERIRNIAGLLRFLGYFVIIAVGISTLVIISHIISMGIYSNREQINTLRLLGAPEIFIAFPFLLEGLLLTLGGGIIASALSVFILNHVYGQMAGPLPFIPLPPRANLVQNLVFLIISLSVILGIAGSLFGLSTSKES